MADAAGGPPPAGAGPDLDVRARLARLDELLGQVEATPGPAGEVALEAVSVLADVYGEALARMTAHCSGSPAALEAITGDELLAHLLVLHGIHPEPVERRAARAVEDLRSVLAERGGEVELTGIDEDGVASVRLAVKGCGSSSDGVEDAVRDAVLAMAPELTGVQRAAVAAEPTFVPLDSLLSRPATRGAAP
jgi:Fe-S cluster biogenesis protein NfuA